MCGQLSWLLRFNLWSPHTLLVEIETGISAVENRLVAPQKVKHRVTPWPSNSTPKYRPQRTEKVCPYKTFAQNVHNTVIHNGQKVETTQIYQLINE